MFRRDHERAPAALAILCALPLLLAGTALAQAPDQATLDDIQATLGSVPTFFQLFPAEALPGAWGTMKDLELSPATAIPGKYKELIGLAVAGQIPCEYCTYFHTGAARLHGATDAEVAEAVAVSSLDRFWSTILEGYDENMDLFRGEVDRMLAAARQPPAAGAPTIEVVDQASALRDIEATFGFVPTFVRQVPAAALAPVWREFKALELADDTAIPPKYKSLIGVAVASQVPCRYCLYADRAFALAQGASEQEIAEAIAMAALTRHWSTFLNGMQMSPAAFRQQTDQVMSYLGQAMARRERQGR